MRLEFSTERQVCRRMHLKRWIAHTGSCCPSLLVEGRGPDHAARLSHKLSFTLSECALRTMQGNTPLDLEQSVREMREWVTLHTRTARPGKKSGGGSGS